jgi:hypothetical protein
MGHEVWSPLKDNSYSPIALGITVNFIETSKSLQEGQITFPSTPPRNEDYSVTWVEVPTGVTWGVPSLAMVALNSNNKAGNEASEVAVAAYDPTAQRLLSITRFIANQSTPRVRLLIPPVANTTLCTFTVLVLERLGNTWTQASDLYPVTLTVANQPQLLITGLVPNSTVTLDHATYNVPTNGEILLNASFGTHYLVIPLTFEQANIRYAFDRWSDGDQSTNKTISLDNNGVLAAFYKTQYFVEVISPMGAVTGAGWHDSNSTLQPSLQSTIEQSGYVFIGWKIGSSMYGLGEPIQVRSPTTIEAVWEQNPPLINPSVLSELWIPASLLLFLILLLLNLRLGRRDVS